jgi:hypothetical protein
VTNYQTQSCINKDIGGGLLRQVHKGAENENVLVLLRKEQEEHEILSIRKYQQ